MKYYCRLPTTGLRGRCSGSREFSQRAAEIVLPILVLQAGDDRLVDARATESFVKMLGSEGKELQLYPGFFHEIFNETERERVFADLERWLAARLAAIG